MEFKLALNLNSLPDYEVIAVDERELSVDDYQFLHTHTSIYPRSIEILEDLHYVRSLRLRTELTFIETLGQERGRRVAGAYFSDFTQEDDDSPVERKFTEAMAADYLLNPKAAISILN